MAISLFKILRIHQWIKQVFIFMPMFFGGKLLDSWCWVQTILLFIAFSFVASAIYCINDIVDVEEDRRHPNKSSRPIASGQITKTTALIMAAGLFIMSIIICLLTGNPHVPEIIGIILLYVILNLGYCFKLKNIAILDIMIVSIGFVLRLVLGGIACNIYLSSWIVCLTFLLAMFLTLSKRFNDCIIHQSSGMEMRKTVAKYNYTYLSVALCMTATITIMSYLMYSVSPEVTARLGSEYIYITSIFVIGGILRYLQVTIVDKKSNSPTEIIIHDRLLQSFIFLWALSFVLIIYL